MYRVAVQTYTRSSQNETIQSNNSNGLRQFQSVWAKVKIKVYRLQHQYTYTEVPRRKDLEDAIVHSNPVGLGGLGVTSSPLDPKFA